MNKRQIAFLTAILTLFSATACSCGSNEKTVSTPAETTTAVTSLKQDEAQATETTAASAEEAGVQIHRKRRDSVVPMGAEGTWTVFVYLCGADLESRLGMASGDMQEMIASSANSNVRFVVQTGGADKWQSDVEAKASQRYLIADGKAELIESSAAVDMGDSKTLSDFLEWGVEKYPAYHMGLVFWDHGSGSINGVCFDETHNDHSLLLKEIDAALYHVFDKMTAPFTFIGFDACLMGTAEAAALLATHADYMIASQETEPGSGWDYTAIGDYLAKNPKADGLALGKVICDSFLASCKQIGKEDTATLSVTDLSKIDSFIAAFDSYAKQFNTLVKDDKFADVARSITKSDNFGGNNKTSGYTNMVDAAGILKSGEKQCDAAAKAISALNDAIPYQIKGKVHADACGLSMYYPLCIEGSQELVIYQDIALSADYLAAVSAVAAGAAGEDVSTLDVSQFIAAFGNDWSADGYTASSGSLIYAVPESNVWDYVDDLTVGDSEVTFDSAPALDSEGNYCFTLSADSLETTDYIEAAVWMEVVEDDVDVSLLLGYTGEVYVDWSTGECADAFDGYWFSLPDGQLLSACLSEITEDYDIYTSKIKLNGEEMYLRFAYDMENLKVWVIDVWEGVDENGSAGRSGRELEKGDVIVPVYDAFDNVSEQTFTFDGDEYKFTGDNSLSFERLSDGDYSYSFCINDIYGNYCFTDSVSFTVDGDDILFSIT